MEKNKQKRLLQKTFQILLPEKSDVWVVVIYGLALGFLSLSVPLAVQALVNSIAFAGLLQPIFVLIALLTAALTGSVIFQSLQYVVVETLQQRIFVRITSKLSESIPRFQINALEKTHPSEMLNRYFDVFLTQKSIASLLLHGVDASLIAFSGMVVLAFYHPALLAFDLVLIMGIGCIFILPGKKGRDTSVAESKSKYAIASWFEEISKAPLSSKNPAIRKMLQVRTQELGTDYLNKRKKHFRVVFRQLVSVLAIEAVASVALLGIGGTLVIQKQLSIGQLVASELIVTAVVASISKLGSKVETFYDLLASVDKIDELFHVPIEKDNTMSTLSTKPKSLGTLRLEELQINPTSTPLSLTLESSTWTSLADEDSLVSRKLLDCLFGAATPTEGFAFLEGNDIRELPLDWIRTRVSLVRMPEIFPGTIRENIKIAKSTMTTLMVWEALQAANLDQKIRELPDGLDTSAQYFSNHFGLQEQIQLTLARTFALRSPIVLIDQILDFLPQTLQRNIQKAFKEKHNPTVVVSTHCSAVMSLCTNHISISSNNMTPVDVDSSNPQPIS